VPKKLCTSASANMIAASCIAWCSRPHSKSAPPQMKHFELRTSLASIVNLLFTEPGNYVYILFVEGHRILPVPKAALACDIDKQFTQLGEGAQRGTSSSCRQIANRPRRDSSFQPNRFQIPSFVGTSYQKIEYRMQLR
jgi:hypothetical protein